MYTYSESCSLLNRLFYPKMKKVFNQSVDKHIKQAILDLLLECIVCTRHIQCVRTFKVCISDLVTQYMDCVSKK